MRASQIPIDTDNRVTYLITFNLYPTGMSPIYQPSILGILCGFISAESKPQERKKFKSTVLESMNVCLL